MNWLRRTSLHGFISHTRENVQCAAAKNLTSGPREFPVSHFIYLGLKYTMYSEYVAATFHLWQCNAHTSNIDQVWTQKMVTSDWHGCFNTCDVQGVAVLWNAMWCLLIIYWKSFYINDGRKISNNLNKITFTISSSTFGILVWNDSGYVNLTQWWYFFIIFEYILHISTPHIMIFCFPLPYFPLSTSALFFA